MRDTCLLLHLKKCAKTTFSMCFAIAPILTSTYTNAVPVDPAVKPVSGLFSIDVQRNFHLYADSSDSRKIWYVPKWGYIDGSSGRPDFTIDTRVAEDGFFEGETLVDFSGKFKVGSDYSAYQDLQEEASEHNFSLAPVVADSADTRFLLAGFEVGNDGRIETDCEFEEINLNGDRFEVPFCYATNLDGKRVSLDFVQNFNASSPKGGHNVTADIPFSGTTVPGWDYDLMDIMDNGNSWDHLVMATTRWELKTSADIRLGELTIDWRRLYVRLRQYVQGCQWSCTENEIDRLFTSFARSPSLWGLNLRRDRVNVPGATSYEEALKQTLRKIISPEVFVSFVDTTPNITQGLRNIAPFASTSASSTFCSGGGSPSHHCYSARKVNDRSRNTALGGLHSWANRQAASHQNPQYLELSWKDAQQIENIEIFTTKNYPISDYDIQTFSELQRSWLTVASIRNNTREKRRHSIHAVDVKRLRIVAKRGPTRQPTYTRINEIVVNGRPNQIGLDQGPQTFYTLKGNFDKIFRVKRETLSLLWQTGDTLQNPTTVFAMQCMTGGFGYPVEWFEDADYCASEPIINVAPLGNASADSSYCSGSPNSPHCYSPLKANDGDVSSTLGGRHSWSSDRFSSSPQSWTLDFEREVTLYSANIITTSGYEIKDYDFQAWNQARSRWITLAQVRNNRSTSKVLEFPEITTDRIRVVGIRGPDRQPIHVRLNEVLLEGFVPR